jgi:hypothetical protein
MSNFIKSEHVKRNRVYDKFMDGAMELAEISDANGLSNHPMRLIIGGFYLPNIAHGVIVPSKSDKLYPTPVVPFLDDEATLSFDHKGDLGRVEDFAGAATIDFANSNNSLVFFNSHNVEKTGAANGRVAFHEGIHVGQNLVGVQTDAPIREIEAYTATMETSLLRGDNEFLDKDIAISSIAHQYLAEYSHSPLIRSLAWNPDGITNFYVDVLNGDVPIKDPQALEYIKEDPALISSIGNALMLSER